MESAPEKPSPIDLKAALKLHHVANRQVAARLGYSIEAVEFVSECVTYSVWYRFEPLDLSLPPEGQHVSAADVCRSVYEHAFTKFGRFAEEKLREWRLLMPLDVGRIVYAFVEEGIIHTRPGDSLEQFDIDIPFSDAHWGDGQNPHHSQMFRPDPVARQSWIERQANVIELCVLIATFVFLVFAGQQGFLF